MNAEHPVPRPPIDGATALLRTLGAAGVDVCFTNPGTSEMHLVAAADDPAAGVRMVLTLFEGVATGAADGYARMTGRPAAALLHLGPGLANGLANLHNARRARVPVLTVVGDHALHHKPHDPPLESDIDAAAGMVSAWVSRAESAGELGPLAASAIEAALGPPAGVSTLVVPADTSWSTGAVVGTVCPPSPQPVDDDAVDHAASALTSGEPSLLLLGGRATRRDALEQAGRIAAATGAALLTETSPPRVERGAGIVPARRLAYRAEVAIDQLAGFRHVVLVDAAPPVTFFAYPGGRSTLLPAGCAVQKLCTGATDPAAALTALAGAVAGEARAVPAPHHRPEPPTGPLTPATVAQVLGARLEAGTIVVDEANTAGVHAEAATAGCPPHDWLRLTGGAIGIGLPLALGAAIAAPDRKVVSLQADGSALYTVQALWSLAREGCDVLVLLLNNHAYAILGAEMERMGVAAGPRARQLVELCPPEVDFVSLARGLGVDAVRVTTAGELDREFVAAQQVRGPRLIEVML